jgi:hypothetical protein
MQVHMGWVIFVGVVQLLGALALWVTLPAWVDEAKKPSEHPDTHMIGRGLGNLGGNAIIGLLVVGAAGCFLTALHTA